MKKELLKSVALILSSLLALWLTELIIKTTMKNSKIETVGKINAVMTHDFDAELTIWGASTAWVNFNPKIIIDSLNISSSNMGIDGTNVDQYAGLLYEFLSYTSESKYLIIALDIHGGLANRDKIYHLHNWLHHIDNENIAKNFNDIDSLQVARLKFIPFYSLTQYDKHAFPYFRQSLLDFSTEYRIENFGYKSNENQSITRMYSSMPFEVNIGDRTIKKIKIATEIADSKGIQCLIVVTPMFHKGLELISNRDQFRTKISELASSNTKILDFSESYLSDNPKFFKDNTHLNVNGANELTRLLVREIKQLTNDTAHASK